MDGVPFGARAFFLSSWWCGEWSLWSGTLGFSSFQDTAALGLGLFLNMLNNFYSSLVLHWVPWTFPLESIREYRTMRSFKQRFCWPLCIILTLCGSEKTHIKSLYLCTQFLFLKKHSSCMLYNHPLWEKGLKQLEIMWHLCQWWVYVNLWPKLCFILMRFSLCQKTHKVRER